MTKTIVIGAKVKDKHHGNGRVVDINPFIGVCTVDFTKSGRKSCNINHLKPISVAKTRRLL